MKCPVCRIAMRTVIYEGEFVSHCSNCLGNWLSKSTLKNIVTVRQILFDQAQSIRLARSSPDRSISAAEHERLLTCPACKTTLGPRKFTDDSPITFNRCTNCEGVWLDHQELEWVQMFDEGIEDLLAF